MLYYQTKGVITIMENNKIVTLAMTREEFEKKLDDCIYANTKETFVLNNYCVENIAFYTYTVATDLSVDNLFTGMDNLIVDGYKAEYLPLVGIQKIHDTYVLGFVSENDGELPVYRVVYFDGKVLRGYVPVKGNNLEIIDEKCNPIYATEPSRLDFDLIKLDLEETFETLEADEFRKHKNREFVAKIGSDLPEGERIITGTSGPNIIGIAPGSSGAITLGADGKLDTSGLTGGTSISTHGKSITEIIDEIKKSSVNTDATEQALRDFMSNNPELTEDNIADFLNIINGNTDSDTSECSGYLENEDLAEALSEVDDIPVNRNSRIENGDAHTLFCDDKYIMPNTLSAPQMSIESFKNVLKNGIALSRVNLLDTLMSPTLRKCILSKCDVDTENLTFEPGEFHDNGGELVGIHSINGIPFLGLLIGGDWEEPVFVMCYESGEGLRMYVPTAGNVYNLDRKSALGNFSELEVEDDTNKECDVDFVRRQLGINDTKIDIDLTYDWEWLAKDIELTITPLPEVEIELLIDLSILPETTSEQEVVPMDSDDDANHLYCNQKYLGLHRRTAPKISMKAFKCLLENKLTEENLTIEDLAMRYEPIQSDLKFRLDSDNCGIEPLEGVHPKGNLLGYHMINGVPFIGVESGRDTAVLVFTVIYFDGESFRGYTPTCGNPFNMETNDYIGVYDEDADMKFLEKELGIEFEYGEYSNEDANLDYDWAWIELDLANTFES